MSSDKPLNTVAIIQARSASSRLPGKVMKPLSGMPMIGFLIRRVEQCPDIDKVVLATTDLPSDDLLASYVEELGVSVVRSYENDVLSRFLKVLELYPFDNCIRITGDCPFVDPGLISKMVHIFKSGSYDYVSNCDPPTYPDGLDLEIFSSDILKLASEECSDLAQREHVTPWIRSSPSVVKFNCHHFSDLSHLRWTVDEPEDFLVAQNIVSSLSHLPNFTWDDVFSLYQSDPSLFLANNHLVRNEGSSLTSGQKLWRRAKRVIPGGNMLLSKRSEMFAPNQWPSYFKKSQGCHVWDLDDTQFTDMSIMGIGTNILGYSHPEVDEAVVNIAKLGNMSTLNCPEEVYLAERLVSLHPWSHMVRFARSGGEANAIAIRIARASTGRDPIAICGYHGWHDWYLASNLNNESGLSEHLLPGLEPSGVPKGLAGTVHPFSFNRLDQLKDIISRHNLAAVKMEVQRSVPPAPGFLEGVRELCSQNGIVLIFDECTSGFRETFGGLHLKYGVQPDMAMFGKALGNGYAITAVIGKDSVMQSAQSTFISSTFWTERIGPTAALKTLEVMESTRSWEIITSIGLYLRRCWQQLADSHGLSITLNGLPALTGFVFNSPQSLEYKTLITQEMLKKGYLAATSCYTCTSHSHEVVDAYVECLDDIFSLISKCEDGLPITTLLEGPVCHSGFKRLN